MQKSGTVKWYNDQKGYGFITPQDGGSDVFVHASAVEQAGMRTLKENQKLSFVLTTDPKTRKASATNLEVVA